VTASQARAARALLGWDLNDLAQKADILMSTVERMEEGIGDASTLSSIRITFENAGVIFVGTTGVRLKP
jgi:transcriptional regulator with XRE-family HTH domain